MSNKNITYKISIYLIVLIFTSCDNKDGDFNLPGINFGTSTYYDSFLFSESSNTQLTKKIKINFNDWAKENSGFANLYFVDDEGNIIGTHNSSVSLYINDNEVKDGIIHLTSSPKSNDSLEIKLHFNPSANSKKFSGYVILQDGNIERINNIQTLNSSGVKLFKWNAKQEVVMNPLKKGLLWFLIIVAVTLMIWFLIIRNKMYPKMARGQIILNSPYYKSLRTKGARQIIFTSKQYKQGWFNKLFAGKIIYEKNDFWQEEIKFSPARRRQLRIKMPAHYNIDPFTSKIDQGKTYTIKGNQEEVKFSFL
jgi:hypothetical protein